MRVSLNILFFNDQPTHIARFGSFTLLVLMQGHVNAPCRLDAVDAGYHEVGADGLVVVDLLLQALGLALLIGLALYDGVLALAVVH